jgi:predicted house-cleaning NTP pyrophosphatase (Maf/HAM1 superfamily)
MLLVRRLSWRLTPFAYVEEKFRKTQKQAEARKMLELQSQQELKRLLAMLLFTKNSQKKLLKTPVW